MTSTETDKKRKTLVETWWTIVKDIASVFVQELKYFNIFVKRIFSEISLPKSLDVKSQSVAKVADPTENRKC